MSLKLIYFNIHLKHNYCVYIFCIMLNRKGLRFYNSFFFFSVTRFAKQQNSWDNMNKHKTKHKYSIFPPGKLVLHQKDIAISSH